MKRLLAYLFIVLGLGLVFSVNAWAGYKVKLKDQNKYGSVYRISMPFAFDNITKWNKAFQKTIDAANKHCKTFNKKTFTFWSEQFGNYSRDANGMLLKNFNIEKMWGITQDMEDSFKVKVRYFCAENIDEAHKTLKKYYQYFDEPFSSTIKWSSIKYSETSKDPFKFKNLVKAEKKKKPKPKKKKIEPKKTQEVVVKKKLIPDISGYDQWIQNSIEGKCGIERDVLGPAKYIKCINEEVSGLSKLSSMPDTSNLEKWIQKSIEGKCGIERDVLGPVKYIKCINEELTALKLNTTTINIAKKEPSQTQEVAEKEVVWEAYAKIVSNLGYDAVAPSTSFKKSSKIKFNSKDQYNLFSEVINETMKKCEINRKKSYKIVKDGKCLISLINYYEPNDHSKNSKLLNKSGININEIKIGWNGIKNIKTLIAKKEPSQTQEVAGKENLINILFCRGEREVYVTSNSKCAKNWNYSEQKLKLDPETSYEYFLSRVNTPICYLKNQNVVRVKTKCDTSSKQYQVKHDGKNFYWDSEKSQIAKVEPTIKPKKKKKVKVAETTQEEFIPDDKDIDNDPPVILIAEAITVDTQTYTLKGKVKDKSKIYLTIDGRQVQVKKGKFTVDRFNIDPDVVEEIKIVAIDKWNNKTEKTIKITIDLQSTELARSFEDLKPNSVRVKTDKNKIAIIIGIEKYANLINLDAKYANRDAQAFRTYATQALGVKASNIKILVDDKATRSQTLKAFKLWLPRIAGDGGKDILIFFAGHGLASDNGEDLYILPQDGESSLLEDTAISRVELISLVQKVNPKSVTMFFDTCYSGQTRDERMLVASLRPIRIVADEQDTPNNFTIFTASNYDQTSGSIEEAKHGMFSYYLMKGLEGKADNNKDKKITNSELIAYLKTNVSKEAFTQNREQDPMLSGDPDQVLMSYR